MRGYRKSCLKMLAGVLLTTMSLSRGIVMAQPDTGGTGEEQAKSAVLDFKRSQATKQAELRKQLILDIGKEEDWPVQRGRDEYYWYLGKIESKTGKQFSQISTHELEGLLGDARSKRLKRYLILEIGSSWLAIPKTTHLQGVGRPPLRYASLNEWEHIHLSDYSRWKPGAGGKQLGDMTTQELEALLANLRLKQQKVDMILEIGRALGEKLPPPGGRVAVPHRFLGESEQNEVNHYSLTRPPGSEKTLGEMSIPELQAARKAISAKGDRFR